MIAVWVGALLPASLRIFSPKYLLDKAFRNSMDSRGASSRQPSLTLLVTWTRVFVPSSPRGDRGSLGSDE